MIEQETAFDVAWQVFLEDPADDHPVTQNTVVMAPSADDARFLANEQYKDDGLVAVQIVRYRGRQR